MIKPIKHTSVKSRRKFDEMFKREAVQNWLSNGKSAAVIAEELGIRPEQIYLWRNSFAPAVAGGRSTAGAKPGSISDLQSQLDAALRENHHLRQQRDILKKTLGILSEPPSNAIFKLTP